MIIQECYLNLTIFLRLNSFDF